MTKVFAVVRKRWWESEHMANLYAGRVPTRESITGKVRQRVAA